MLPVSQDNQVFLWDIRKATGPLLSLDQHNGSGSSISASGVCACVRHTQLFYYIHIIVLTAHNGHVCGMTFTSDGLFLVTTGTDQRMRLWDVFTGMNMLVSHTINRMLGTINRITDTINRITDTIERITNTINRITDTINRIIGTINRMLDTINRITGSINRMLDTINRITGTINRMLDTINRIIGTIRITDTINRMLSTINRITDTINRITDTINRYY